jgi:hypothetical protein
MTPTIAPTATITLISPFPEALLFVAAVLDAAATAEVLPAAPPPVELAAAADELAAALSLALALALALELVFKRLENEGNCTGGLAALQMPCATV